MRSMKYCGVTRAWAVEEEESCFSHRGRTAIMYFRAVPGCHHCSPRQHSQASVSLLEANTSKRDVAEPPSRQPPLTETSRVYCSMSSTLPSLASLDNLSDKMSIHARNVCRIELNWLNMDRINCLARILNAS